MKTIALAFALFLLQAPSFASGLDDVHDIDIVRVVKQSGQVFLYLVLDPDQSAASPEVLLKVRRKLKAYRYYVTSGQVWKNEANSKADSPVVLTVLVTGEKSKAVEDALNSLRPEFDALPTSYAFSFESLKPKTPSKS